MENSSFQFSTTNEVDIFSPYNQTYIKKTMTSPSLSCVQFLSTSRWMSDLEMYIQQKSPPEMRNDFNLHSQELRACLVDTLRGAIPYATSIPHVNPTLDLLLRLHLIYRNIHCEDSFFSLLQEAKEELALPKCLTTHYLGNTLEEKFDKLMPIHTYLKQHAHLLMHDAETQSQYSNIALLSKKISHLPFTLFALACNHARHIFVIGNRLSNGNRKTIKVASSLSSDELFAIASLKKPWRNSTNSSIFLQEAQISYELNIMQQIKSIVRMDFIKHDKIGRLLMELCEGVDLHHYLEHISSPRESLRLGMEIAETIRNLHACGFTHLDLKTTNIFIRIIGGESHICLGDLESVLSLTNSDGAPSIFNRQSTYPSPEVFGKTRARNSPDIDLWALGEILHILFVGRTILGDERFNLFHATRKEVFQEKALLLEQTLSDTLGKSPNPIHRCIADLFSMDPEQRPRPSAAQVYELLHSELQKM